MGVASTWKMEQQKERLLQQLERDQIGVEHTISGPFGLRKLVYADHTASGRALQFIESYIADNVLPYYANTHSGTSHCSRQMTFYREEARDIIRNSVNASSDDCVIFVGSGCTGAVHKLIGGMKLKESAKPVVVFVGPFEHHSNLLPWREIGSKVVNIVETQEGTLDINDLEHQLKTHAAADSVLIGAFNASSNLTGVLTDTVRVSCLLHQYGALALWDYASSAPYSQLDMNPVVISSDSSLAYKDAIYFSMHKFIGGVDSPGVLVAKKNLFKDSSAPDMSGGGTVFFVTGRGHRYLRAIESREEGGTPNIVGSIRAGLAMQVKQAVGVEYIMKREEEICRYVYSQWGNTPGLIVTGPAPSVIPRLPIFSLVFTHPASGRLLHHNFICSVLSDLFGIQARGGCSCAGPYAQHLLGIDEELASRYEALIMQDQRLFQDHLQLHEFSEREVLRPGMTRLSFPYFLRQEGVEYIVKAVLVIAERGWKLLPQYTFNPESGLFHHPQHHPDQERVWLSSLLLKDGLPKVSPSSPRTVKNQPAPDLEECIEYAVRILQDHIKGGSGGASSDNERSFLVGEAEELRWFLLPSEAEKCLAGHSLTHRPSPFIPRVYNTTSTVTVRKEEGKGEEEEGKGEGNEAEKAVVRFHHPPKSIMKNLIESISDFNMIQDGDRVLVCLSGGKDSLSLLHSLKQYQYIGRTNGVVFQLGAVTVDPGSSGYNPRPLIPYLAALDIPYYFEEQAIMQQAIDLPEVASICSFCSRMKRGRLYACARREGYNVLAMGQHLDDLAESFLMSIFHNGMLRTMKANYTVKEGDLRVIRPLVYVRERDLNSFAKEVSLPVITENCPACFAAPKERERVKQLLAAQELLFPRIYHSLQTAMRPLMKREIKDEQEPT